MEEYRYSGPASGIMLSDGTRILFWLGRMVSLPEEYDYVKVLVALKHPMSKSEDTKPVVTPAMQSSKRGSSSDSEVRTKDTHDS